MPDLFSAERSCPAGYRFHKLEVYNWGTFDSSLGQIYSMRPQGQSALLIGQNGSGKSTLVDALLTLLVRPVVRNYNVAAGAHKQERDERSYIKGAYGRFSRDEDNRGEVRFLRTGVGHYSALLACFRNERTDQAFTLAQVLYLDAEGRADKIYCFAAEERSLSEVCAGLTTTDKLRQQLVKRGFRATTNYSEYHGWFVKATGVLPKAMDMFNQTVAVKDIQSLNRFIREHMLEAKAWGDRVDDLLTHFAQLTEAHQSLVRIRDEFKSLEPIADKGGEYAAGAKKLEAAQQVLDASTSFFRHKTIELFGPACEIWREDSKRTSMRRDQLAMDFAAANEECRRLTNEIEQAGGERLRQIPLLIENHVHKAATKREAHQRFDAALRVLKISETIRDAATFADLQGRLSSLRAELEEQLATGDARRVTLAIERRELEDRMQMDRRELETLQKRQGNLPQRAVELRQQLCEDLRLEEKELPFAAELIAVKLEQRDWESTIELVLKNFALSLLVPQRLYPQVSSYVERTRLLDARGQGQRLVYLRVGERAQARPRPILHTQSLLQKLDFREGNPLLPWVKAELEVRFDFRCCDTIEEFQSEHEHAVTRERHIKFHAGRHEKDDRDRATDARAFVLGWDNREKKRRLVESIQQGEQELQRLDAKIDVLTKKIIQWRDRQAAIQQLAAFGDFASIDYSADEHEIASLTREKQQLEEASDSIRVLKQRLAEAQSRAVAAQAERDQVIGRVNDLEKRIRDGEQLLANARKHVAERQKEGNWERQSARFPEIEKRFGSEALTCDNLLAKEPCFKEEQRAIWDRYREALEPLKDSICSAMGRFLRDFPAERHDLDVGIEYLEGYLGLRQQIEREDLPRHERRFKERLDEKVIHEIGILAGELRAETGEIRAKIDLLNKSLRVVEYRPGTHMRLEPREVRDADIGEFQTSLKECLSGTFEGTAEANEARYVRIEKLIVRLRDDTRWRDKVTDVRRWFDFAAREIEDDSGKERNYYEESTGQSGGEKAKLAFTILVAAIAYQYDLDPEKPADNRFHFVVVDEMFSKVDDQYANYALQLFRNFGLQLLIVAPLDAKARVTEPYVGCYLHAVKDAATNHSEILCMTAREFQDVIDLQGNGTANYEEKPRRAAR